MNTEYLQRLPPATIDDSLPLSHVWPADPKPPQRRSKIGSFFRRIFKCFCPTPPLSEPGLAVSSSARDELSDMELRRLPPVQFYSPLAPVTTIPSSSSGSSTDEPPSPVTSSDPETSSSGTPDIPSSGSADTDSSSGASATGEVGDDFMAAPPRAPLVIYIPAAQQPTADAVAAAIAAPAASPIPADTTAATADNTTAAADAGAPKTHKPTRRSSRAGKSVQQRRQRAAARVQQQA